MDFSFITDEVQREAAVQAYTTSLQTAVSEAVKTHVETAVQGLKTKNDELLAEKKAIQEKLKNFSDIEDPIKAREALKFFQESTEAQMIKDGRTEELIQMKTAQFRADMDAKIKELETEKVTAKQGEQMYKSQFERKMVEDHLRSAAIKAGVLSSAVDDVLLRGGNVFSLSVGGEVEARDAENKLKQDRDGLILTSDKWITSLKESHPHYWPPSIGGGLGGPGLNTDDDINARLADLAAKGKVTEYRELRKKVLAGRKAA